ncbi:hypothetical protein [Acinetobacter sp. ANC 4639]
MIVFIGKDKSPKASASCCAIDPKLHEYHLYGLDQLQRLFEMKIQEFQICYNLIHHAFP